MYYIIEYKVYMSLYEFPDIIRVYQYFRYGQADNTHSACLLMLSYGQYLFEIGGKLSEQEEMFHFDW